MTTQIILPKLGFSVNEAALVEWMVDDGAAVKKGDPLCCASSWRPGKPTKSALSSGSWSDDGPEQAGAGLAGEPARDAGRGFQPVRRGLDGGSVAQSGVCRGLPRS